MKSEEELLLSIVALPKKYHEMAVEAVAQTRGSRYGLAVERIILKVLATEGIRTLPKKPLYETRWDGKAVGRITPDIYLEGNRFIEVTKWGDSNKLSSILANGYIVKRISPGARYYALVSSYKTGETGWTTDAEVDFYLRECAALFPFKPVDQVYGFGNISELLVELTQYYP